MRILERGGRLRVAISESWTPNVMLFGGVSVGSLHAVGSRMNTQAQELRDRVKRFAIRLVRFVRTLSRDPAIDAISRQVIRSGTGMSANYHATCRARSRAEFVATLGVVLEEADESEHWLDVLHLGGLASGPELDWLRNESSELRAIFNASVTTARTNYSKSRESKKL